MGKYYVAGIPFDSENSLKHYGVKGMEWDKHKFGLDADTRFIKWIDPNKLNVGSYGKYGKMAEAAAKQKYGAAAPTPKGRLTTVYNKQSVMNSRDSARRNMAQPWGIPVVSKEARDSQKRQREAFYNQAMQEALKQKATADRAAEEQRRTQQKWNNSPIGKASNFIGGTANKAGKAIGTAATNAGQWANQQAQNAGRAIGTAANQASKWANQQAQNVGNAVGQAAGNVGNAVSGAANAVGNWVRTQAQNVANSAPVQAVGNAVSGAAQNAVQNVGNTVGDWARNANNFIDQNITGNSDRARAEGYQKIADDLGNEQYAQKAQNAQEQADNSLFGRIGNTANAVGNWFGDRAQDVSQAAQNVGNWVGDRVQDAGNAVSPVAQNVSNAVGKAAQNVSNTVSGAANKATEGTKGFLNSAGQWVSGVANNVKNTASKAASDASKGASGFLNSAGQWVSNAAGNVGKAAQDAGKAVSNAAQNVGNTVGQAAEQARGGIGGLFDRVGNAVGGAANAVGDWAGNAAKDVGNTVGGAVNAVGDWAGNAAQNVGGAVQNAGNWIGDQARNVGGAVTGAAGNAADWARDVSGNVSNFVDQNITGNSARAEANRYNTFAQNPNMDSVQQLMNQRAAENAQARADNTLFGRVGNAAGNVSNWAGQAAQNVGNAVGGAANVVGDWAGQAAQNVGNVVGDLSSNVDKFIDQNITGNTQQHIANVYNELAKQPAYTEGQKYRREQDLLNAEKAQAQADNSLFGRIRNVPTNVGDWARTAAGQVGNWAGQAAQNVGGVVDQAGRWIGDQARAAAASPAGQWVGNAAQGVGQFINDLETAQLQPKIQAATQQMADNYRQYLNDHPENPQSPQHADWLMEQIKNDPQLRAYYEQNIREQTIPEQTIPEQLIRERFYHSAISEKPDGVSDAFWEKFTADGGTREEYERDWR